MSKKHFKRYDKLFNESPLGRNFEHPIDGFLDLSSIKILYSSVDTVKQLYKLHLDSELIDSLQDTLENTVSRVITYKFAGYEWLLRRGGASGYQYNLQNSELGLVLLIKSRYAKLDCDGTHLKIEVSPKLITEHSVSSLQLLLDNIADLVALKGNYTSSGCAVHLALDFQGWEPPKSFNNLVTCRSRRITDRHGISELTLDNDICSVHGKGQSYLFGSAATVQMAVYNKSLEARASDKLDYMEQCWSSKRLDFDTTVYDPEMPVWRIEIRYSHSVINQFSDMNIQPPSSEKDPIDTSRLTSFESLAPHLGGLWEYGLNNFRYDHNTKYIHPAWSVFMTESDFNQYETGFSYKRKYKTAGIGNEKNIAIALGNMLSIFARNKINSVKAYAFLKKSGIWSDIVHYFRVRGMNKADIKLFIEDGLLKRRLSSKVSA